MSDSDSVCSSHSAMSVSLTKMECPYCNKDLQVRVMFNHIRKMHYTDFLRKTNRRYIEEASNNKPLKLYWTKMNDFDEEDDIILYACLATNKTFITESRAIVHFAKDKKLLKEHTKQLKEIKKDYNDMKKDDAKKQSKNAHQSRFMEARRNNDPVLARVFWKGILHFVRVIEICQFICDKRKYSPETSMYIKKADVKGRTPMYRDDFDEVPYKTFLIHQSELLTRVERIKEQRCLDVKTLESLYFDVWTWWNTNYRESILEFFESIRKAMPDYWPETSDEYFNIANESMPGVDF